MAPDFRFAAAAAASLCLVAAAAQEQELVAFSIASDAVLGSPSGATLSAPGFAPSGAAWTPASAPCTVLACLVQAGAVPGVGLDADALFVGDAIHALVNASAFDSAWWYWTTFSLPARGAPGGGGDYVTLEFNGVGYKADVWLNGALLADKGVVAGSFVYHALDATPLAVWGGGSNTLALRVERQDDRVFGPGATNTTDLGISFVDWSYDDPPDANMGLWRSSFVRVHGAATVRGAGVSTALPPAGPPAPGGGPPATFASANLTVYADVRNFNAAAAATGTLAGRVVSPAGAQLCAFSSRVSVPAGATSLVAVSPAQPGAACLALPAPVALWWPWQMGAPSLHALDLSFTLDGAPDGEPSDALAGQRFGVRTATSALTPAGAREFAVNGVPLLVAGGGWSPDLFQRADGRRLAATLALTRHLGLNAVRLEGKMEPDAFFDAMDELGMLALPGWCCCDAWQNWGVWTDATRAVARASMASQAARLRTHASVLAFLVSSDELPPEAVERLYLDELTAAAWPSFAANVSAASAATSKISGPTGVKMSGPYSWVSEGWIPPRRAASCTR